MFAVLVSYICIYYCPLRSTVVCVDVLSFSPKRLCVLISVVFHIECIENELTSGSLQSLEVLKSNGFWRTWACVNSTLLFRLWASGNCIGLASHDDSAADIDMFPIFMPVDAGDPLINLETAIINVPRNYHFVLPLVLIVMWVSCHRMHIDLKQWRWIRGTWQWTYQSRRFRG